MFYGSLSVLLVIISALCGAIGVLMLGNAQSAIHEIEAGVLFIVGAVLFAAALLASIVNRVDDLLAELRSARNDRAAADKARDDVATERWETLCTSLERLEGTTKKNRPPSNVGEEFDLPLDRPSEPEQLKVKCSKCGRTVKAKPEWAGRTGKCPGCNWSIQFPAAATIFDGIV